MVYVTQELDGQTCLGVCHDCYGKFPKSILKPLTTEEVSNGVASYVAATQQL